MFINRSFIRAYIFFYDFLFCFSQHTKIRISCLTQFTANRRFSGISMLNQRLLFSYSIESYLFVLSKFSMHFAFTKKKRKEKAFLPRKIKRAKKLNVLDLKNLANPNAQTYQK